MADRRQFWVLLTHAALSQAVVYVLRPATSYQALGLGVPAAWLGLLAASFAVVPLLLALPSGRLVDRFGERSVAVTGGVLTCLAAAGFVYFGGSVVGLVGSTVVLGTAHLCAAISQQAIVANTARAGGHDTAFGHYTFAASLGQATGPLVILLSGGSDPVPDTTPIFLAGTVLACLVLLCTPLLRSGTTRGQRAVQQPVGVRELLRLPGMLRALATSAVALATVDVLVVYLPALGAERGLAAGFIGVLLGLRAASAMASRLFLGKLVAFAGRRPLLLGSLAAAAVCLCVIAAPVPVWLLTPAVAVAGFGLGVGQPLTMSWLAQSASTGVRGRAMSLRLTGNRAGQIVVPSTVGFVATVIGASGVLYLTAAGLALVDFSARKLGLDRPEGGH